ncbi:YjcZ family sporulation protein [Haladaptatus sp. DFWS20]|uniref:YjcZ family sporulation protein n=1 Tax=Haladaptatus sp. DFWS20 TaxID=3403467 RepID=UPI003EB9BF1B
MTNEKSPAVDSNSFPLQQSRRTLVQVLGSVLATGAISGSVAGGSDTNTGYAGAEDEEQYNAVELKGLSITDDEFHLEWLQFAPTIDGETKELFTLAGFAATIENDTVTEMGVDSVEIHDDLEQTIIEFIGSLANGNMPDGSDTAPNAVSAYLDGMDTRHFEHLQMVLENGDVAETLERNLQSGGVAEGYGAGFILILVLFILLVIIGAGFGIGTGRASEGGC